MGYDYAPPCGGRGIRRRGGYGSDAVRDMLFLAAEAVELELLAVRQHVRVEELLEPMPQRHARLHARMQLRATSHADITAALRLSAAQAWLRGHACWMRLSFGSRYRIGKLAAELRASIA